MLAGKLRERIAFDFRVEADDGYGNFRADWREQFTVWARLRWLIGSEPVIAARLTGVTPAIITVRDSSMTRRIATDWRCRLARKSLIFNIKSITPTEKQEYIDFLVELGTAEG